MQNAISLHSVVPVRTEPREGAEQETQMLFGELCQITEPTPNSQFLHVRLEADGSEGWVDTKMISPIGGDDYKAHKAALQHAAYVAMPMAYAVSENNGQTIPLTAGTRLPDYRMVNSSNMPAEVHVARFQILGVGFRIDPGMVIEKPLELNPQNLQQVVRFFLNVPYLWGGKNAMGMDCSGFVQVVMSLFGKVLPRNASQQARCGRTISKLASTRPGDLVFFDHNDGRISHVGIILNSQSSIPNSQFSIIHCSGRVKVEKIDETGIFSVERADKEHPQGRYTHSLVAIQRL